ncbi:hypothetical protein A0E43_14650 [Pectobacterium cacticida]
MALTDVVARTAKPREKAYKLADAHGLYLLVSPNGSKRWYLKYRFEGKESRIAFGAYPLVSLAKAREKRDEIRLLLLEGIHPTEKREEEKEQAQEALNTFAKVAQDLSGAIAAPKATHRPALKLNKLPDFLARIERHKGRALTRLALKLTLCVFIRSSELCFARWPEIDFKRAMWTIPAERKAIPGVKHSQRGAKMRSEHLVPSSESLTGTC